MRTKLSLFCDKLIEAGWLAAAIVVPVLFNVRSAKIFEVDKIALFRSLVLLMVLAWVIRRSEAAGEQDNDDSRLGLRQRLIAFVRKPVVLPAFALAVAHAVATAASVWPHGSLWGSYERRQGLYATLSYVTLFLLIVQGLRWRLQIDRLVGLLVVTSIPVSMYAIVQRFGLDPVPWSQDVAQRVTSMQGNPIFTSAYLIMVVPLALGRAVNAASQALADRDGRTLRIVSAAFYGAVVLLHLVAIVLTQSRGPLMGLFAGLFFFLLVFAVAQRRKRWVITIIALAGLVGGLLVVVNLPQTPLAAIKEWPYVGRLTSIRGDPSLQSRALMWQSALDMATATPLRILVGYGPESARVAFYPYITSELADLLGKRMTTGRFHNETMDAMVGTGILGLLAYLAVFGSLFAWSLKSLRIIRSPGGLKRFVAVVVAGALLSLLGSWLLAGGLHLVALMLPAGMLLAMAGFVVVRGFQEPAEESQSGPHQMLLIALLSALVAHFVEIQTGIAVTATRAQFWLYAGLIAALAVGVKGHPAVAEGAGGRPARGRRGRSRRRGRQEAPAMSQPSLVAALVYALGVGLLLIVLGFDFITPAFDFRTRDIVAMAALLLLVWLLGGVFTLLEVPGSASNDGDTPSRESIVLIYGAVSLGVFAAFPPFHIAAANVSGPSTAVVVVLYLFVFAATLALGTALLRAAVLWHGPLPRRFWRQGRWWLYPILTLLVALLIWQSNVNVVRADIVFTVAQSYRQAGRLDRSIELYDRALDLAPRQGHYYPLLGQAFLRKALKEEQAIWFEKAQEAFEKALELNPIRPDRYAYLGLLYDHWGTATTDAAQAAERLETALSHYERATSISPHTQGRVLEKNRLDVHLQLAELYRMQGKVDQAIEELRAGAEIAPPEQRAKLEQRAAELRAGQIGYWADVKPDCRVDVADVQAVAGLWRCREGDGCYEATYDRDGDGVITVIDSMRVVAEWGWACP
jgi:O-antigen ligase